MSYYFGMSGQESEYREVFLLCHLVANPSALLRVNSAKQSAGAVPRICRLLRRYAPRKDVFLTFFGQPQNDQITQITNAQDCPQ